MCHTKAEHTAFYGGDIEVGRDQTGHRTNAINEEYIASRPVRLGLLQKGDVALYNQQVQHTAHRTPHTAHRTPHTAHRTPYTVHRTPRPRRWLTRTQHPSCPALHTGPEQVLHCGGANESPDRVRRQFYFSVCLSYACRRG